MVATPPELMDIDLEKRVVGGILQDPDVIVPVAMVLLPDDLSDVRTRLVYEVMRQCLDEKARPSVQNVLLKFQELDLLGRLGGAGFLAELENTVVGFGPAPTLDVPKWAERLAALADRRALHRLGGAVQVKAADMKADPDEMWRQIVEQIARGKRRVAESYRSATSSADEVQPLLAAWLRGEHPDSVPTGITRLDFALGGGWPKGQLSILAGRTGSGKTYLAEITAKAVAEAGGNVVFSSLEMRRQELAVRDICREGRIDGLALRRGDYAGDSDVELRLRRASQVANWRNRIFVCDDRTTVADMHYGLLALMLEKGSIALHVVDYIELTEDVIAAGGETVAVNLAYRRLKALCGSVGCAELVLSQIARAGIGHHQLSSLRWGGDADADVVVIIDWPWNLVVKQGEKVRSLGAVEVDGAGVPLKERVYLYIPKGRHGVTEGRVSAQIVPEHGIIRDVPGSAVIKQRSSDGVGQGQDF